MVRLRFLAFLAAVLAAAPAVSQENESLLFETASFTAEIFHIQTGVPGVIIAAVRDGESVVYGVGETVKGSGREPDGDTVIGVGSVTKTFTGLLLATYVADGTVDLTDPVAPYVDLVDAMPERDGRAIRFVDLATHSSGFGRELEPFDGVAKYSDESFRKNLAGDPLLFTPGTGVLYSNIGFDVLAIALSSAGNGAYAALLEERVLGPLAMADSSYDDPVGKNAMQGYDWNGNPMNPGETPVLRHGASQLNTTANDMIRYLEFNLQRDGGPMEEARLLAHAPKLLRDGLDPVYGMDESGHMDGIGLGWVVMMPEGDRPLIVQKAGGSNGIFSYLAFAPTRGVGVFMAINQFDFAASILMAQVVNELIASLAPR